MNRFKEINDRHGHLTGDRALQSMAGILRGELRAADILCRVGGDEFALILPETDRPEAEALRRRLEAAASAVSSPELPGWQGAAMGIATCPDDGDVPAQLISAADAEMYSRKRRSH